MYEVQILATKPKNQLFPVVSWGIRLLENAPHSHVSIYFVNHGLVRHAHFNNIEGESFSDFSKEHSIVKTVSLNLSKEAYIKLGNFTQAKIGKQTGYFSTLFGSIIPMITRRLTGKRISNPFVKGITCAEFVRESLRQINEVLVFVLTNDTPKGTFTTIDAMALAKDVSETL
jgi:hypothetical protein